MLTISWIIWLGYRLARTLWKVLDLKKIGPRVLEERDLVISNIDYGLAVTALFILRGGIDWVWLLYVGLWINSYVFAVRKATAKEERTERSCASALLGYSLVSLLAFV